MGGGGRGETGEDARTTPCECWGSPPAARSKLLVFTRVDACHWRHSAAICASEGHLTAKTEGKVMKMIDKELLRVLEVFPEGQPRLADIYTGCSMSLVPLRSVLGSRRPYH